MKLTDRALIAALVSCILISPGSAGAGITTNGIEHKIYLVPPEEGRPLEKAPRFWRAKPAVKAGVDYSAYSSLGDIYTDTYPVRGLHVTSWIASSLSSFQKLIDLVNRTELNALVIDLKEADGKIAYDSRLGIVKEYGTLEPRIQNIDRIISMMRESRIYPIARICVFKDTLLANKRPELAVKDKKSGGVWKDRQGQSWIDQYNKKVWDYIVSIAEEAVQRGFREVQFDYVRFPSDGIIRDCEYPAKGDSGETVHALVIRDFLVYAKGRLKPYGTKISADLFGLTCSVPDDLNIGQLIEIMAKEVDYVSPMVYPSHYYPGMYGLKDPESSPYITVHTSMKDAVARLGETHSLRPWLQDFSMKVKYGPGDVEEQIRAAKENGVHEWLLWNPSCRYTAEVLRPKSERNIK